jgi:hypothetical protein
MLDIGGVLDGETKSDKGQSYDLNIPFSSHYEQNIIVNNYYTFKSSIPYKVIWRYPLNPNQFEYVYDYMYFDSLIDINLQGMNLYPELLNFTYLSNTNEALDFYYSRATLLLKNIYLNSDIPLDNDSSVYPGYLYGSNGKYYFAFENIYYYSDVEGKLYLNRKGNTREVDYIPLPKELTEQKIIYELYIEQATSNYANFTIRSTIQTKLNYFGSCSNSLYCVNRTNEHFNDPIYGDEVQVG